MRKLSLPAVFFAFLSTLPAFAAVQNRITGPVSDQNRSPLAHTIPARARLAVDTGTLPPGTRIENMTIRFAPADAQQIALDQLLADQQNPASPRYHQWLTPEQFGAQFGISAADQAKVVSWLTGKGFTVNSTSRGGTFLMFSGTAAQAASAFGSELHSFSENGQPHFSNVVEPTLPAAIANLTATVTGLNDFRLRARARARTVSKPEYTSSITGNHFFAPGDFYTVYDTNPLLTAGINGAGQTIAVVGQVDISLNDVAAFRSASGLPANPPAIKLYGTDPGSPVSSTSVPSTLDLTEAQLDVEWSGAVAPGASILYVLSTDVVALSLTNAIDNNLAPIISISYGNCESGFGTSNIASFQTLFKQANAQGQTIAGPAGDSGATDCDYAVTSASGGLAVDFPASSPNVTAVGGTQFSGDLTGTYWNTANGSYSGSALSYIPEVPWNETSVSGPPAVTNGPGTPGDLSAGGGGASAYFTKPAFQTGTGVPNDFSRDVPDVVFNAAAIHDPYLICAQGSCTNGYRDANGGLNVVGGTSASTPSFAGVLALLEQKIGGRVGNANPTIYSLANSSFYSSVFHDITSGNNNSPCTAGTPNCAAGGSIGYNAGTGYDQATGWGSIDVNNFVTDWPLVAPIGVGTTVGSNTSSTALTTPTTNVAGGISATFTATVTSATTGVTTAPTGSIQFLVDGAVSGGSVALTGNTATFTLATTALASGAHTVTAAYSGDGTYTGSKGAFQIDVVSATAADFSLTPATSSVSTTSGGTASGIVFTLTPVNGFNGSITLTATTTASINAQYSFSPTSVAISGTSPGTTTLVLIAHDALSATGRSLHKPSSARNETPVSPWLAGSGLTFAGLLLLTLPRRRRWTGLLVALLSVGLFAASGCSSNGSSSSSASSTLNATPGTYTILVTAAGTASNGTAVSHNATVTFVVQ